MRKRVLKMISNRKLRKKIHKQIKNDDDWPETVIGQWVIY